MPASSNHVVARDLVVIVDTAETATDSMASSLAGWLARVVNQCHPVEEGAYPHKVVAGTWHSDYHDEEADKRLNRIVAVVHQTQEGLEHDFVANSVYGADGLTVTEERAHGPAVLSADAVAQRIDGDPPFTVRVAGVGVSGVSSEYASDVWAEIISKSRNWMDGSGGGYMVHPMWMWSEDSGIFNIREMSFNFGWGPRYYLRHGHYSMHSTV